MNFLFDSCFFQKNSTFNQNNNSFLTQNRVPFNDVTQQVNSFFNTKKNIQINIFPKNFNDYSNDKENFTFLKKKSFGDNINNTEKVEESKEQKNFHNIPKKYSNDCYIMNNSLINCLNEDDEDCDKENFFDNNDEFENNRKRKKNQGLSFKQILNEAINEKKEYDKNEREKKKANKLRQLKMLLKNRKNAINNNNNNFQMTNKENIINNGQMNYMYNFQEQNKEKELNLMTLD